MAAGYAILLIVSFGVPAAVGCIGLALAFEVFLAGSGITLSPSQAVSVGSVLLSIPIASLLAGIFFDTFAGPQKKGRTFSLVLPVLACALMLQGTAWVDYLAAALTETERMSFVRQSLLVTSALSAAFFCAALSAFVILAADVVFELPVRWLEGALRARLDLALAAARPLFIVLAISLSFNLIVGLVNHELWPAGIAARMLGN